MAFLAWVFSLSILRIAATVLFLTVSVINGQVQTKPADTSQILFTVIGEQPGAITALRAEDIRLRVNDQPVDVISLERIIDQPLVLALLIDTSLSQARTFTGQKLAADLFLLQNMRHGKDKGAIVSFTHEATIEQSLTADLALLRASLARVKPVAPTGYYSPGILVSDPSVLGLPKGSKSIPGSTALWDAVWATCEELFPSISTDSRKAIILLTDGNDTASKTKMRDAVERAIKANVAVYAIGIGDPQFGTNQDDLNKISTRTGGRAFFPAKPSALDAIFQEIDQQLRAQYKISFRTISSKTGSTPKIRINIVNPVLRSKGLRVSHQRPT